MNLMKVITNVETVINTIMEKRLRIPSNESMLVAVSGIDGSGKGYITTQIVAGLKQRGMNSTEINIDGWLNLPHKRFNSGCPAEHFYHYALRFEEMFEQSVLPLKHNRSVSVEIDFAEETATEYRKHTYKFKEIDVIVLEGIYLLKGLFSSTTTGHCGWNAPLKPLWRER